MLYYSNLYFNYAGEFSSTCIFGLISFVAGYNVVSQAILLKETRGLCPTPMAFKNIRIKLNCWRGIQKLEKG